MDYAKIAENLFQLSGGVENITSITHCSTRLRFFVSDKSKVDTAKIEKTKPVLGVVFKGDELQIVLGQNLIPVYTEAAKMYDASGKKGTAAPQKAGKMSGKDVVDKIVGFVSAAVTPLIPGLVAGGMLKVFLLLATLVWPAFKESQSYDLLGMVADVPFYFMPIFVAYGAAKKLGATPLYAMTAAASLVLPKFVSLIGGEDPVFLFGLPVMAVKYNSTLLPALLIALFAYYCEKFLVKVIPGILRSVFVGMLTIALTFTAGVTILGPFGDMVGNRVVHIFLFASEHFGPIAIALLAAAMPWLVMTGMHHAVTPFMVQAFADPGYDVFFRPSYILHNMAEGGACLGVAFRAKNKELRAQCLSLAFGCIVAGVTEPAIYGVNFRLKKPMIGVMAGAAAGGVVAGLLHATAYVYGYSTILALPIFQDTIVAMAIAIAVAFIGAAIVTALLGFDESLVVEEEEPAAIPEKAAAPVPVGEQVKEVSACVNGKSIPLSEVHDEVFSQKILGDGIGIQPTSEEIVCPADGVISTAADSKHAVGIQLNNGTQLLIHVGIDTVSMNGKGFDLLVKEGDIVKQGQTLMRFSRDEIKKAGFEDTVMLLVTENDNELPLNFAPYGEVKAGSTTVIRF